MTIQLSSRFKQLREDMKLTQAEIAAKTGVHVQTWSKYERGEQVPSVETISAIADRLLVNPGWLLTGIGEMFKYPKDILKRDVRPVIDRIKKALNFTADEDVEKALGVRAGLISSYSRMANEIPYPPIMDLGEREGLSLDWLLTGEGPMRKGEMLAEEGPIYKVGDPDLAEIIALLHEAPQDKKLVLKLLKGKKDIKEALAGFDISKVRKEEG
jgi:transcriptional regulator with XRE-family HTH domain